MGKDVGQPTRGSLCKWQLLLLSALLSTAIIQFVKYVVFARGL